MKKDEPDLPPPGRERTGSERASSWERAAEIFAEALEKPVTERRGWLAGLTGIDEALRLEVASLLDASERAGDFLTPGEIRLSDLRDILDYEPEPTDPEDGDL